ncbi:hypothetical protein [Nostoc sp.]
MITLANSLRQGAEILVESWSHFHQLPRPLVGKASDACGGLRLRR